MIELSVVSGTYNRLPMLKQLIASVRASARGISYEIILVDGGSTDGSIAWIEQQADIKLIQHKSLLGAIKAYNDGAAAASGEYVIFANDDLTFVGDSIARAVAYMRQHGEVGIGLFYTNRSGQRWHVAEMPAHHPDGRMTNALYGGIMITPRWLGNRLGWWTLPKARTYGGDNAFCARCIETGWRVVGIDTARVSEPNVDDDLKRTNNVPQNDNHPDSAAYLKLFPRGPELGHTRLFDAPSRPRRILYAPIYELGHRIQHQQKRGLRRALQRVGVVREVDYVEVGPDAVLSVAADFRPDLVLTQFHSGESFGPGRAEKLRALLPEARLVNWNGDVYDKPEDTAYVETLKYFDLQLVVNASAIPGFEAHGIKAAYWQIGYEPDGVGSASQQPDTDIVFLGNGYSEARRAFGQFLLSLPYSTALYGTNWSGMSLGDTTYNFRLGRKIINGSRIVLGDGQWNGDYGFVSNRLFQSLAAGGGLLLHQEFPGMTELLGFVAGVHLVTWSDHTDLADKLAYYLDPAHEGERAKIARAGQLECLKFHSFEARVQQLFDMLTRIDEHLPGANPALIGGDYA